MAENGGDRSTFKIALSLSILAFGLLVMGLEVFLFVRLRDVGWTAQTIRRLIIVIFILTSALFLITAGYSQIQISPVFGLLGAVWGYLFGQHTPSGQQRRNDEMSSTGSS